MKWKGIDLAEMSEAQLDRAEADMIAAVHEALGSYNTRVGDYRALGLERQRRLGDEILPRRPDNRTLN